jgi:hypothetical protein
MDQTMRHASTDVNTSGILVALKLLPPRSERSGGGADAQRSDRRVHGVAVNVLADGHVLRKDLGVEVRVLYFEGCPSWTVVVERLRLALNATGHEGTPIQKVRVESATDAAATGFAGSPTVMVDGQDLFPGAAPVAALTCRLYPTSEGVHGSPSLDALLAALSQLSPEV